MPTVLVVDDSKVDQRLAGGLLEQRLDVQVVYADNGALALDALQKLPRPDIVLTDMQMPEMDGLELVRQVRKQYPSVPVILMTAKGSEEVAAEALRAGATGYVPKRYLSYDLAPLVERTLILIGHEREQHLALQYMTHAESQFVLDNDTSHIHPLIQYLKHDLMRFQLFDETEQMRVRVALDEALTNAITHGNLEGNSQLREMFGDEYPALLQQRRTTSPFCDRHVYLTASLSHEQAQYVIRDEGKGFDPSTLPDPTDPTNIEKCSGRGILLIRSFMDEVHYNDTGNQITLIKHRQSKPPTSGG